MMYNMPLGTWYSGGGGTTVTLGSGASAEQSYLGSSTTSVTTTSSVSQPTSTEQAIGASLVPELREKPLGEVLTYLQSRGQMAQEQAAPLPAMPSEWSGVIAAAEQEAYKKIGEGISGGVGGYTASVVGGLGTGLVGGALLGIPAIESYAAGVGVGTVTKSIPLIKTLATGGILLTAAELATGQSPTLAQVGKVPTEIIVGGILYKFNPALGTYYAVKTLGEKLKDVNLPGLPDIKAKASGWFDEKYGEFTAWVNAHKTALMAAGGIAAGLVGTAAAIKLTSAPAAEPKKAAKRKAKAKPKKKAKGRKLKFGSPAWRKKYMKKKKKKSSKGSGSYYEIEQRREFGKRVGKKGFKVSRVGTAKQYSRSGGKAVHTDSRGRKFIVLESGMHRYIKS